MDQQPNQQDTPNNFDFILQQPTPPQKKLDKKLIVIIVLLVILGILGIAAYVLGASKESETPANGSQAIAQEQVSGAFIEAMSADEASYQSNAYPLLDAKYLQDDGVGKNSLSHLKSGIDFTACTQQSSAPDGENIVTTYSCGTLKGGNVSLEITVDSNSKIISYRVNANA